MDRYCMLCFQGSARTAVKTKGCHDRGAGEQDTPPEGGAPRGPHQVAGEGQSELIKENVKDFIGPSLNKCLF